MSPITSERFHEALLAAGVVHPGDRVRRIVIVAEAGHAVTMYVERVGDERLVDVLRTTEGIDVVEASHE